MEGATGSLLRGRELVPWFLLPLLLPSPQHRAVFSDHRRELEEQGEEREGEKMESSLLSHSRMVSPCLSQQEFLSWDSSMASSETWNFEVIFPPKFPLCGQTPSCLGTLIPSTALGIHLSPSIPLCHCPTTNRLGGPTGRRLRPYPCQPSCGKMVYTGAVVDSCLCT